MPIADKVLMHLNFHFTAVQTLWTLTFAALLVLLVVLLGRECSRRFPWFTTSIALVALRLLTNRLLYGRLAPMTLTSIFLTLADATVIIALLVLIELARRAFAGATPRSWLIASLAMLAVGGTVVGFYGPWPDWKTLTAGSPLAVLRLMQLLAQKGEFLTNLLAIELGLLVVALGRRFQGGWRTHVQRIAIGLSTAAAAQVAIQVIWQYIAQHTVPHSREEYMRVLDLREKLFNADGAIYVIVVVWWIVCLWLDEKSKRPTLEG